LVDEVVVVPAEQDAVGHGGGAVVAGPLGDVVDLAEVGWGVASGVLAVAVAGDDRAA
jgi:hypothetical protein